MNREERELLMDIAEAVVELVFWGGNTRDGRNRALAMQDKIAALRRRYDAEDANNGVFPEPRGTRRLNPGDDPTSGRIDS